MKQVGYRRNIPPAQNVNIKCESDLQFRPHLISTKARIPFFVVFFLSLVFWTAILDFCGGFRWQLVPRLPFPVPRSPLPVPRFSNIQERTLRSLKDSWGLVCLSKSFTKAGSRWCSKVVSREFTCNIILWTWQAAQFSILTAFQSNSKIFSSN